LPEVPRYKEKKEKTKLKPQDAKKLNREMKDLKYNYLMKEQIDWNSIERRPKRTTTTPSKYNDMVTPTKAQASKNTERKNLNASGSTVEATPTPKKNNEESLKKTGAFEARGTRSSATLP
jgi:hypothetical protein